MAGEARASTIMSAYGTATVTSHKRNKYGTSSKVLHFSVVGSCFVVLVRRNE